MKKADLKTNLRIFADPVEVARHAGEELLKRAEFAVRQNGRFTVVLSGGSTPKRLYQYLAEKALTPEFLKSLWPHVHFFWGDERTVSPDHAESNYHTAYENFLSKLKLPAANIHRMKGESADPAKAAADYEAELRAFFKLVPGELPRFDLVFLGMGPDGHTASLFPGRDTALENQRLTVAPWVAKFNTHRITLTPAVLNNAACVLFLVTGEDKAETLEQVLNGDCPPARFPVQLIRPVHGELFWFVDQAATSS